VSEHSARNSETPVSSASVQLAALINEKRDVILASFEEYLTVTHSPALDMECAKEEVMAIASEIITDIRESVAAGDIRLAECYKLRSWALGEAMVRTHLSPADSLRVAVAFFRVAVTSLTSWVRDDPDLLPAFVIAILALNESSALRIREATLAYTGSLLNRIHHAHLEERYRIARELHDRLGEGFSAAMRQLELDELLNNRGAVPLQTALAKESLAEGMRRLRLVISDLRQDPVTSLEKALTSYVTSRCSSASAETRTGSRPPSWTRRTSSSGRRCVTRSSTPHRNWC
jgi:signal transduction histidine kinase